VVDVGKVKNPYEHQELVSEERLLVKLDDGRICERQWANDMKLAFYQGAQYLQEQMSGDTKEVKL